MADVLDDPDSSGEAERQVPQQTETVPSAGSGATEHWESGEGWRAIAIFGSVPIGVLGFAAAGSAANTDGGSALATYFVCMTPVSMLTWVGFFWLVGEVSRLVSKFDALTAELRQWRVTQKGDADG
ncbi:MAG: hypothetical protein ACF8TS_05700 [Maioricimonas sp. JB049]